AARGNGISRNENISDEIDHEIEHIARPAWKNAGNTHVTGDCTVDPVNGESNAKADKHGGPLGLHRIKECSKRKCRSCCSKNMDTKRAGLDRRRHGRCSGPSTALYIVTCGVRRPARTEDA